LLDSTGKIVAGLYHEYAPTELIPGKNSDKYILFNIDENGKITNWYDTLDFSNFRYSTMF